MTTSTAPRLTTTGKPSIRADYRYRPQFDANGKRLRRKGGRPMGRMIRLITERDTVTGGFKCAMCGDDLTGRKVEVDHIIPGRLDWDRLELEPADLICLCGDGKDCNGRKSGKRLAADEELGYLVEIARRNEAFGITGRATPEALQAEFPR